MGPSCSGDSHERRGPQPAGRGGWPGAGVEQRLASSSAAERCCLRPLCPPRSPGWGGRVSPAAPALLTVRTHPLAFPAYEDDVLALPLQRNCDSLTSDLETQRVSFPRQRLSLRLRFLAS